MKKLLIMSIALVAIMATVFTVSAFAANTVEITGVTLAKYGSGATFNDDYVNVTVNYTVPEGTVDRLTFYLAAQDLSSALEGEEAKVIYIDEQVNPGDGSLSFVIEKERVRTAFRATGDITTDTVKDAYAELLERYPLTDGTESPFVMTFKLGGTDVDTAASRTVVFKSPTVFGDVTLNGLLQPNDGAMLARGIAGSVSLDEERTFMGDVTANGALQPNDKAMLMRCIAGTVPYANIIKVHY